MDNPIALRPLLSLVRKWPKTQHLLSRAAHYMAQDAAVLNVWHGRNAESSEDSKIRAGASVSNVIPLMTSVSTRNAHRVFEVTAF